MFLMLSFMVLLQNCVRKKPTSTCSTFSSALQTSRGDLKATNDKRLNKALRVLDIISSGKSVSVSHHSHLRFIQELIIETNSNKLSKPNVLGGSNTSTSFKEFSKPVVRNPGDPIRNLIRLHSEGLEIDAIDISHAVSSCFVIQRLSFGAQVHGLALTYGLVFNVYVGSSLISLYGKCGRLGDACNMFEEMPVRNVVSWTAIIAGFAKDLKANACLELYRSMKISASKPNDFTFTALLCSCSETGSLSHGRIAHCQIVQTGFHSYMHISTALISMYCKCGDALDAYNLFEKVPRKDVFCWNTMITGCAQHGLAIQAINLFEEMKNQGVKPDVISFLSILSSCRHACLVNHCLAYFNSMIKIGLEPELDHYSCVVDVLGRAGLLKEAWDFISRMPIHPNGIIWGSLLSSCRVWGNFWLGIQAAENRLFLEPDCASTHVQLANLYASVRCWDRAARVRKLMKDRGLKTVPGCSWVEIKSKVYMFGAERSNSKMDDVLCVLNGLLYQMRWLGYVPQLQSEVDNSLLDAM